MASEFDVIEDDIEKNDADRPGGSGLLLVAAVLLVSCAVHLGLMYACSNCPFAPLPEDVKAGRKWTRELPVMQVQKLAEDVFAPHANPEGRPVAAPDAERPEARVERLAEAAGRTVAPEMPKAESSAAPTVETAPEPAPVDAAQWKPRQQIAAIEAPTVPDEAAALPRLVIPKVARVPAAADIVPPYALLPGPAAPAGAAGGLPGADMAAKPLTAAEAMPLPPAPAGSLFQESTGFTVSIWALRRRVGLCSS